jgi:polar amino acid transport system substrate-binding protein
VSIGHAEDGQLATKLVKRTVVCDDMAERWSIDQATIATGWQEAGKVRIGYRSDAEPFSFERAGEARGIVVEMCRKIAADVAVSYGLETKEPEFVAVPAQDRFAALHRGDIDLLCDSSTLNLERMACFGHTLLTFVSGPSLAVRVSDAAAPSAKVIKVGVLKGSSTELILHRDRTLNELSARFGWKAADIETQTFPTYEQGFKALLAGNLDAFFADREILLKRFFGERSVEVLDRYFSYEPYTIFTRPNDRDLIFAADQTLTRIFSSVEIHQMLRKYLTVKKVAELEVSESLRYLYVLQRLPSGEFFSAK